MDFDNESEPGFSPAENPESDEEITSFWDESRSNWKGLPRRKTPGTNPSARPRLVAERPPLVKLSQTAYRDVLDDLGAGPFTHEKAGLLLGPVEEDDLVTHYVPDIHGYGTPSSFTLDAAGLNETLSRFKDARLNCKGVVHVHPPGVLRPSFGDLRYVRRLFANPNNAEAVQLILPIVCNGRFYPYVIDSRFPSEVLVAVLVLI